jgi:hypothetical protein
MPHPGPMALRSVAAELLEIGAVWDRELMKDDIRSLGLATEDAVRHGDMVVDVEVEAAAEAFGESRPRRRSACTSPLPFALARATPSIARAASTRFLARRCDRRRSAQRRYVPRAAAIQGNAQHPLANGHVWKDSVREVCGRAAHAARVARRPDATWAQRGGTHADDTGFGLNARVFAPSTHPAGQASGRLGPSG